MSIAHQYAYRPLTSDDLTLLKELLRVFRHAFNDSETYQHAIPSDEYLTNLLGKEHFTVVVAMKGKAVVGGRVRIGEIRATAARDLYLRSCRFRRSSAQGCCHRTDQCVRRIAAGQGANVIFVQADLEDGPATALYRSLGTMKTAHHFDIEVSTIKSEAG